jgi:hypothetical protein
MNKAEIARNAIIGALFSCLTAYQPCKSDQHLTIISLEQEDAPLTAKEAEADSDKSEDIIKTQP